MTDDLWSLSFMYGWPDGSLVQRELFVTDLDKAHVMAAGIKENIERLGMIFMWSQICRVGEDAVTLEDNYYENVPVH